MEMKKNGFSTILALGIIAVVFLLILSGLMMVNLAGQLFTKQLRYQGQAQNVAEAGLVDALNFFRRAGNGAAVTNFNPQLDSTAIPPLDDSAEPLIGIVRTFRVSSLGNICGRYEVRRQDLDNDGTVESNEVGTGCEDITNKKGRMLAGAGNVWLLESHGFIFVDHDDNPNDCDFTASQFDDNSNGVWDPGETWTWIGQNRTSVLIRRTLRTQIQRMSLAIPGGAAGLNSQRGDTVTIGDNVRIMGGDGSGIAYPQTTGSPTIDPGATIQGSPAQSPVVSYDDSILGVFGVTQSELIASADDSPASVAGLPDTWSMKLYVVEGPATFTTTKPLIGSGVLVVIGDCTVPHGSNFQGVIYVTGNYTQTGFAAVSGAVIVQGDTNVIGGSSDFAEIVWDENIWNQVQAEMIQYRFGRNPYVFTNRYGVLEQF